MSHKFSESLKVTFEETLYKSTHEGHYFKVYHNNFLPTITLLKKDFFCHFLLDICAVDNSELKEENRPFKIIYILLNLELNERVFVELSLDGNEVVPSLSLLWKGAQWMEREVWDLFGLNFDKISKRRLLNHHQFIGHPLLKKYPLERSQPCEGQEEVFFDKETEGDIISLSPCHPAIGSNIGIVVEVQGENIVQSSLSIGHCHRGFEKICEGLNYNQIIPYTDRLNHQSAALNNVGWCLAVEKLMDIAIPDRGQALRMVFSELSRIIDHFFVIGATARDCQIIPDYYFCYQLREYVLELFEKYCGARITLSLTRVGGMGYDMPKSWPGDCFEALQELKKGVDRLEAKLSRSSVWMERNQSTFIKPKDALSWGFTGPSLRACGINYDVRKVRPYYFYDDVDFEVPLGIGGSSYDRYLVRIEEIKQSLGIIGQVLENLPAGPVSVDDEFIFNKSKMVDFNSLSKKKLMALKAQGPSAPSKEIYSSTEAANGELGFYIIGDGSSTPYRVKMRAPSFALVQSFSEFSKGLPIDDALIHLGSLNIVPGEIDR